MIKQVKVYKASGIYKILNKVTKDFYIGSSMNCYKRMYQHQTLLRNNKHHSPYLQHAWNKYGSDSFEYLVLEYFETKNEIELRKLEQQYLDRFSPVYNISKDAISSLSTKYVPRKKSHTEKVLPQNKSNWEEVKSKISNTVKSLWADSNFREYQLSCMNSPKAKINYSNSMKCRYKDKNYKDRVNKSFQNKLKSGNTKISKLSKDSVLRIRDLASDGVELYKLEKLFGVSKRVILRIINRETWNFI